MIRNINLIYELVRKNLRMRYARSLLGVFWAFLSPFLTVGIFYIVFSLILKVKIEEAPFVLYLMSAVFPWRFFQDSLMLSTTSLVDNKNLIRESRFPHYLIPVSIVFTNAIIFLPSLIILIFASLFVFKGLPLFIVMLPLVLVVHFCIIISLSIILSILYVKWRDVKYILEVLLLLLFYVTPVFYSISLVKKSFSPLLFKAYMSNPFVGILNSYRLLFFKDIDKVFQGYFEPITFFVVPIIFAIMTLAVCFYVYRKNRDGIIDHLTY